jgi:hypothetical protein
VRICGIKDRTHSSNKVVLKEDASTGRRFSKKHAQQQSAQQEDTSARRRLSKTALAPSPNDLVLVPTEAINTFLKVIPKQFVIVRVTRPESDDE